MLETEKKLAEKDRELYQAKYKQKMADIRHRFKLNYKKHKSLSDDSSYNESDSDSDNELQLK